MSTIQISNLTFGYDSSPQILFEDLNLTLDTDWKLGLVGRNGKGKSTFLRLLAGQEAFSGFIQAQVEFEYYPPRLSDLDQLPIEVFHTLCPFQEDWELLSELNQLDPKLVSEVCSRPFSSFSQGEQGKFLMASLFCKPQTFLLLDEPETSLDYEGRKALVKYLKGKQGFILVSHDRFILDELVDHILYLEEEEMSLQVGNYSSWKINQEAKVQGLLQKNEQLHREIERLKQASDQTKNWAQKAEKQKKQAFRHKNQAKEFIDRGFQGHKAAKVMKRSKSLQKRQEKALEEKKDLLKIVETQEEIKMPVLACPYRTLISLEKVQVVYEEKEHSLVPLTPISFSLHPK
ncbi:MAG: ATP-binding cassette domain-containing protein, partial [Allobaculum sp.]|nr:ATP-binding cassette domain-containing protein [Allobaculum sp.]